MNNNTRIAHNTAWLYIRLVVVLLINLYTTRVVLDVLGVVDYGIYNVVGGFVALFAILNSTLSQAIQRFYNYSKGEKATYSEQDVYNVAFRVQIILSLIIVVLLETIGLWYVNSVMVIPEDRFIAGSIAFHFSVASLIFVVMQIPYSASVLSHEKMDFFAAVGIIDVVLRLIVILVVPYLIGDRLILYGAGMFCISIINFLLYYIYSKRNFSVLTLTSRHSSGLLKSILSFSWWSILDVFAYTVKVQGPTLLINSFFGPVVNAARGIAAQVMNAVQGFSANSMLAFRPQLVESCANGNVNRSTSLMFSMSKISFICFFALATPVVIEINYILSIWLGNNIPDYTVSFTILCLADMLICSLNAPLSNVAQAVGEIKQYNIIRAIVIVAIVPISWAILELGGDPNSVYWVSLFMVIINQPVSMVLLKRVFKYSYRDYLKRVIVPCLCYSIPVFVVAAIPHLLLQQSFLRLLLVCMVELSMSIFLLYFVILSNNEKQIILNLIKKH